MTTSQHLEDEVSNENKKKCSRFNNVLIDALYNIIAWLPATIISYIVSSIDF